MEESHIRVRAGYNFPKTLAGFRNVIPATLSAKVMSHMPHVIGVTLRRHRCLWVREWEGDHRWLGIGAYAMWCSEVVELKAPLFVGLSRHQRKSVSRLATSVKVEAGTVLAREGSPAREFVIFTDGNAIVSRGGRQLMRLGPGDFFGEVGLLFGGLQMVTVSAETDLVLKVYSRREFNTLLDTSPIVAKRLRLVAAERLYAIDGVEAGQDTAPVQVQPTG